VAFLVSVVLGFVFGAADQYLGSRSVTLGLWASTAAQMSAPWLVLPFLVGITQLRARRATMLGLVVTASALVGYFAMTYSPIEIEVWSFDRFTTGMVAIATSGYNPLYILGGLLTGPAFGLLGQRWRVRQSLVSAALVAGVLCLEPLARGVTGVLWPPNVVWGIEVVLGTVVAMLFVFTIRASRRARTQVPSRAAPG